MENLSRQYNYIYIRSGGSETKLLPSKNMDASIFN